MLIPKNKGVRLFCCNPFFLCFLNPKKKCTLISFFTGLKRPKLEVPDISSSSDTDSSNSESVTSKRNISPPAKAKKFKIPKIVNPHVKSKEAIQALRDDLPNLNHHSDETLQNLSWTELFRLDSKLDSRGKSGKKLTERLQKNLEKIKRNPSKIEAGEDNRSNKLHSSRFIGGHICQNSDIWLQARETIGISGLDPISRYDSDGVGLSGHINSHFWALLHNPGDKDISITRLSPEALKGARTSNDKDSDSCKKDFKSINEVRHALATIRAATGMIHPWNMSVTTLEYFLNSVHFGDKEMGSASEKVSFVSEFVDEVLLFNAEAWDDNMPFMSASKIGQKWTRDMGLKMPTWKTNPKSKDSKPNQNQNKFQQKEKKVMPNNVCRRFNYKLCPTQNDDFCPAPWDSTVKLKHVCGFQRPDRSFCLQKHPFIDHK